MRKNKQGLRDLLETIKCIHIGLMTQEKGRKNIKESNDQNPSYLIKILIYNQEAQQTPSRINSGRTKPRHITDIDEIKEKEKLLKRLREKWPHRQGIFRV